MSFVVPALWLLQLFVFADSETVAAPRSYDSGIVLDRLQRRVRQLNQTQPKGCIDIFKLQNGQVVCGDSGCRMRCMNGYRFIGAEQSDVIELPCDQSTNQLMFRGHPWRPELTLCAPHCEDGCHNGGSCVSPGQCECPVQFSGPTCKNSRLQADQPAPARIRLLAHNERRVHCDEGKQMPDGATDVILVYEKGHWWYEDGRLLRGVDQVTCSRVAQEGESPKNSPPHMANKPLPTITTGRSSVEPTTSPTTRPQRDGPERAVLPLRTCSYPKFQGDLQATVAGNLSHLKFTCRDGLVTKDGRTWVTVTCRDGVWWRSEGQPLREEHVQCVQ